MSDEVKREDVPNDISEVSLDGRSAGASTEPTTPIEIDPSELVVVNEYKNMVPMSRADFEKLKRSIELDGQKFPITINKRYEIIDGYGRTDSCRD